MDLLNIIVLALVQGLTEFLPISSSAHLILLPYLGGWADQGLMHDIAAHLGTLLAVVLYFRHELLRIGGDWLASLRGAAATPDSRLGWAVLWGTVPAGIAGLLWHGVVETSLRSPLVIASTTITFGLLLWWADARARILRDEYSLGWRDVMLVGLAQALALVPGTSRSGITITAGLFLGLTREAAARYSFLLSIPIIMAAGALEAVALYRQAIPIDWGALVLIVVLSCISAFACIHFFLKLIARMSMLPFVIYRLLLGVVLIGLFA